MTKDYKTDDQILEDGVKLKFGKSAKIIRKWDSSEGDYILISTNGEECSYKYVFSKIPNPNSPSQPLGEVHFDEVDGEK